MERTLATSWWPLVSDHQGWPPNMMPAPGDFSVSLIAEIVFIFVAGAAVVIFALPWAIRAAVRSKNYIPLIVMTSGLLCSLLEPMLDLLGHLHGRVTSSRRSPTSESPFPPSFRCAT